MTPGELFLQKDPIILNQERKTCVLAVTNVGDRPIQVGSHFHFFEVNRLLSFSRPQAFGMRLDIPSGTSVRFEPGETRHVTLIPFGGRRRALGANNLTRGMTDAAHLPTALRRMHEGGFRTENNKAKEGAQA